MTFDTNYGKLNTEGVESMDVLTKRQADILQAIKEFMAKNGYPPTVREIGSQVGLSSPATIQFHLTQLEQKGYIKNQMPKTGQSNC